MKQARPEPRLDVEVSAHARERDARHGLRAQALIE
jgi:hypothetical protein